MKNIYLFILFSLLLFQSGMTQKQDFHWIYGARAQFYPACMFGANWIDFHQNSLVPQCQLPQEGQFSADGTATSLSNPEGELLMASDGSNIYDRNLRLMENGDSLSPSDDLNDSFGTGVTSVDCILILRIPDSDNQFIVLHQAGNRHPTYDSYYWVEKTYYSTIDLNENEGMGKVVEKNKVLMSKLVQPRGLNAIRHANGRDWWIPIRHHFDPVYYVFLLDPDGISFHHTDTLEVEDDYFIVDMRVMSDGEQILYLGTETSGGWAEWMIFKNSIHIVNFDRCSGRLSHNKIHTVEISTYPLIRAELSLDDRFLYAVNGQQINQYDLHAENVAQSLDTLARKREGENREKNYWQPRRTPRGEILVGAWSSRHTSVVHNPELKGTASNTERFAFEVPQQVLRGSLPNHPNYRIGPIDGSPCDTLGIDNEPVAWFRYNDMNLEPFERRFTDLSYFRPENWHWDFGDGTTFDGQHPGVHDFPGPGEYYVCLTVSNENAAHTYCQWVVIDEVSNIDESLEEMGFAIYPNPSGGNFTLELNQPLPSSTDLKVYDLRGVLLRKIAMPAGERVMEVDFGGVPSGMYLLEWQSGGKVWVERLVVE